MHVKIVKNDYGTSINEIFVQLNFLKNQFVLGIFT